MIRLPVEQAVGHDLAHDEVRPRLVGAAVAQAHGARRAIELRVEVEPIKMSARRVARGRRLQRSPGSARICRNAVATPACVIGPSSLQLGAERLEALEMRARIAVHAHLGDPRLEHVEAQHADLEQANRRP